MTRTQSLLVLVGRVCLAALFLTDGVRKVSSWSDVAYFMEQHGMPIVEPFFLPGAILLLIGGGLSVLLGLRARIGALALVVFLIPATLIFHPFWDQGGESAGRTMMEFLKNLALIGGLLFVVAFGAGRYSVDTRRKIHEARHG